MFRKRTIPSYPSPLNVASRISFASMVYPAKISDQDSTTRSGVRSNPSRSLAPSPSRNSRMVLTAFSASFFVGNYAFPLPCIKSMESNWSSNFRQAVRMASARLTNFLSSPTCSLRSSTSSPGMSKETFGMAYPLITAS